MQDLGALGGSLSEARGVSADGRVVVGWAQNASDRWRAFRWENGIMQDLGTLPGGYDRTASGVSADGRVVVGRAQNASGYWRAVRWTSSGIEDLNTIAIGLSPGSYLSAAWAISPNGRYIAGWGYNASTGRYEGWVMDLLVPAASSERVGVTAAGNNLAVRPAPCSTSSVGTLPAGIDGAVLGTSQACNSLTWLPTRWANGLQGWTVMGAGGADYLAPLAGQGIFPNVSAPLAYPVRVGPNASALNVRTGPGTENSIITAKPAGATGWAFEVFNNTAANIVWWKIRWDDGVVGWSAEGVRGLGIYLTLAGQPRPKAILQVQVLGTSSVEVQVFPQDLNSTQSAIVLPATLVYLSGERVSLTAPKFALDGARFIGWRVNGKSFRQRTLTLYATRVSRITLIYTPNTPQTEDQFLGSLVAPWRQGQVWLPSTYDSHVGSSEYREYAVDFNRLSSEHESCPSRNDFLEDCNEPVLASHAGRVYTRAQRDDQGGCTGYGNYAVVVSTVRPTDGDSNTYLATIYAHLNYFLVQSGTFVEAGTPIGRVGSTGSSTGPHLHYEIRQVSVSGSTLTLGTRVKVLNNPRIRLSGQPLEVNFDCQISGLGYGGPAITGTAPITSLPQNIEPPCPPYNCPGGLTDGQDGLPDDAPSRCEGELPDTLTLYLSDVDGDGCVDDTDLLMVLLHFGETWDGGEDINWDGVVDEADLIMVLMDLERGCGAAD